MLRDPLSFLSYSPKGYPKGSPVLPTPTPSLVHPILQFLRGVGILRNPLSRQHHHVSLVLPVLQSLGDVGILRDPLSRQHHHVSLVHPVLQSLGDVGILRDSLSHQHHLVHPVLQSLGGSLVLPILQSPGGPGNPKGSPVLPTPSCVPCPSHPTVPRGRGNPKRSPVPPTPSCVPCPSRLTVPRGCGNPKGSPVPPTPSCVPCPSRPTVPRGCGNPKRFPVPPTPPCPSCPTVPRGIPCPVNTIMCPLSFPSYSPQGDLGILRDPLSCQHHHVSLVLPVLQSPGGPGNPKGSPVLPTPSCVPCPSRPTVPRGTWES